MLVAIIMGRDPDELAKRAKYQPPAIRMRGVCYTKKSPCRYNEVVQANIAHTKWMCKYHIVFTPKYRRKIIYNQYRESIRDILK